MLNPRSPRARARSAVPGRSAQRVQRVVAALVVAAAAAAMLVGSLVTQASAHPSSGSGENSGPRVRTVYRSLAVTSEADSFVSSRWRKARFGSRRRVAVGTRSHNTRNAYLRFVVPHGGTVVSAQLTVTRLGHWRPQPVSARYAIPRPWSERHVNDLRAPRIGSWIDTERAYIHSRKITFDVTPAFRHRRVLTVAIIAPVVRGLVQFASRQARTGRPVLHVVIAKRIRIPTGPLPSSSSAPPTDLSTAPPTDASTAPPTDVSSAPSSVSTSASSSASSAPPSSASSAPPTCTMSAKLVPSCGRLWGITPMQFQQMSLSDAVHTEEQIADRPFDIVHSYHVNDQLFPTPAERAVATEAGANRLLLINWKPATDMSWAAVAAGQADARIDREADYLKANWNRPFFLTIYHEPEDNVVATAGSGYTASDYAAMYRHTVLRLRNDGVTNAITVMNFMAFDPWALKGWFPQLWPGNDVVDWIGLDPYGTGAPTGYLAHDFATLVNRKDGDFPGYYTWATTVHPDKPIMLCEWGVSYDPNTPAGQAAFFNTMNSEIADFPDIHALVYYDVPVPPAGSHILQTTVNLNATAREAYRAVGKSAPFTMPAWRY